MDSSMNSTGMGNSSSMDMGGMDMGGMGMGASDPHACKMDMMFNFYTIDACFLTDGWHIRSKAMFAGSCIGVILLTMCLEFLRRCTKTYDRFLIHQHETKCREASAAPSDSGSDRGKDGAAPIACTPAATIPPFRPNVWQQAIRSLLHMVQFAVAYILMLLAMYYNVYFLVCIFIGAFLGAFAFHWENLTNGGRQTTSASREPTVCCA